MVHYCCGNEIPALIASANSQGSRDSAHMRRLARAFSARYDDEVTDQILDLLSRWIPQHEHLLEAFAHMR